MFDDLISASSSHYGIPVAWIQGVIQIESNWNPNAISSAGAIGLMQIMSQTGIGYGVDPSQLTDPATNIDIGTHLLSDLRVRLGDDLNAILSAYNSGNPNWYKTNPAIADYVTKVTNAITDYLQQNPLMATSGIAGALAVAMLIFWWTHRKGK